MWSNIKKERTPYGTEYFIPDFVKPVYLPWYQNLAKPLQQNKLKANTQHEQRCKIFEKKTANQINKYVKNTHYNMMK